MILEVATALPAIDFLGPNDGLQGFIDELLKFITSGSYGSTADAATAFSAYNSQAWAAAERIANNVFKPVGAALLTAVFAINFTRTILSIDANDSSGGVMKLVIAIIRYTLWMTATQAAPAIVREIAAIGDRLAGSMAARSVPGGTEQIPDLGLDSVFTQLLIAVLLFIPALVVVIAQVGIHVAIVMRFAEFYILAAGSPVAMSLGGDEATKPAAIGYLRELATVAIQGAFILVVVEVFSYLNGSILSKAADFSAGGITGVLNAMSSLVVGPVVFLVLIFATRRLAGAIVGKA